MCGYAPVAAVDGCTTAHWSRSGWRNGLAPSVVGTPAGSLAKARRISSELGELVWHGWRAPVHSVFLPPTGVRGATTARRFHLGDVWPSGHPRRVRREGEPPRPTPR